MGDVVHDKDYYASLMIRNENSDIRSFEYKEIEIPYGSVATFDNKNGDVLFGALMGKVIEICALVWAARVLPDEEKNITSTLTFCQQLPWTYNKVKKSNNRLCNITRDILKKDYYLDAQVTSTVSIIEESDLKMPEYGNDNLYKQSFTIKVVSIDEKFYQL